MTVETNDTISNIPGEGERMFWTVFHVVIALLSLTGDSIILIGTTRYKAIKLHRVIVVIIQHLAVSNLMLTVFRVLPIIVSLVAEGWILGKVLCLVNLNLAFICTPATALLTCVLSTCKLLIVYRPLKTEIWSRKRAHVICGIVWLVCVLLPHQWTHMFFMNLEALYFDYINYICNVNHVLSDVPVWLGWFEFIFGYTVFSGMIIILITSSVFLLFKARQVARRHSESVRWQGILTVTLTAGVFLVSYLPDMIVPLIDHFTSVNVGSSILRACSFLENVNIVANFFVYSLTVRSFRDFLLLRVRRVARQLGMCPASATPPTLRQPQRSVVVRRNRSAGPPSCDTRM